jgi:hypothetical protein
VSWPLWKGLSSKLVRCGEWTEGVIADADEIDELEVEF